MLRIKLTLCLLTIFLFASSCSQLKPNPQPLPSPTSKWTIILNQSGGIAGVLLKVEISSDGQLNAEDQHSHRSVTQTLSAQTITTLNQIVSTTAVSTSSAPQSGCADCFIYDLEIRSEESDFNVHVDDVTMKDSSVAGLITFVIKLRDDALRQNP
jgi:hypothetical protein